MQGTSGLPVVDRNRRIVGMIGQGNLVRGSQASAKRRGLWLHLLAAGMNGGESLSGVGDLTADQVMNPEFISTTETAPIEAVARLLLEHDVDLLPVVREGRLVGIIGKSDVLEAFVGAVRKA
jgi:CBS domain-containing protein